MSKPYKLGFIGGGINSAVGKTHETALKMDNRWTLESGCFSKDYGINRETASKYGINEDRTYKKWTDFLEKEKGDLDAVVILTPTNVHTKMVKAALNLGYAVICEKAMSATYQEAEEICETVQKNSSFLAVTYNYTGYPMVRELRHMVKEGKLGRINQIQIEMPQESFIRLKENMEKPSPQDWRLEDGEIPTISLDLGIHLHNMIYFLTGEKPIEVISDQSTFGNFDQVVDNVMSLARYTGDLRAQIWYSKCTLGNRNGLSVRVYGDEGSAEWIQTDPEKLKFNNINGQIQIIDRSDNVFIADDLRYDRFKPGHPAGFIEAFANHYYDIADSLKEFKNKGYYKSPFVFDCIESKEGLGMLKAINKSSNKRSWQLINTGAI